MKDSYFVEKVNNVILKIKCMHVVRLKLRILYLVMILLTKYK